MAFVKANTLTTSEFAFGNRFLGQIVAAPTGRIDKVSVYLEPVSAGDPTVESTVLVILEAYAVDGNGFPTGPVLASDSKTLYDISLRGMTNFRLEADVPTSVGIVLRIEGGDADYHVTWRYVTASSGGEEQLLSTDGGGTWTANPTKKFAYVTFSQQPDAVDIDNQTAFIDAGRLRSFVDDTNAEFSLGELDRAAVTGDTVAVSFGDFVFTLVVDQSGSMTWNDRDGLRFDFLEDFVNDIESSLPLTSTATYNLIKFRGRRIGKMSIEIQGSDDTGSALSGVRLVRKAGSAPTTITDGVVVFDGLAEQFFDDGVGTPLVSGTVYHYKAFAYGTFGTSTLFSQGLGDFTAFTTPVDAPVGVAAFEVSAIPTNNLGVALEEDETDFGYRKVELSWINPAGFDYSTITVVRRNDRMPSSPTDGDVLLLNAPAATTSLTDTFSGLYEFINGLPYFYRIFTTNSIGIKCLVENAMSAIVFIPVAPRPWEQLEAPLNVPPGGFDVSAPPAPTVTVVESRNEISLSWSPASSDSKRYKLFYKETEFPVASDDTGRSYDGELLFDGTGTSYVHRFLANGEPHFYVLIALDGVENVSTPVKPLVSGKPPKPDAEATTFFAPEPVSGLTVEVVNSTTTLISWTNPEAPFAASGDFFFGDTVRVVATVEFLDSGNTENFVEFEFNEESRAVANFSEDDPVDANVAIDFARAPSSTSSSITSVVSVTPLIDLQNKISSANLSLSAALRLKNRATGAVLAEIKTTSVTVNLKHPFSIDIKNEPEQTVSRRTWVVTRDEGEACESGDYEIEDVSGVYTFSGDPFFALVEASFRNQPLGGPINVTMRLTDKETGELTKLVKIAEANAAEAVLQTTDIEDEVLDRSGEPSGDTAERSLIPLTLPPSNIPGDLILTATAEFNGYIRTTSLEIHYEPVLNVDLALNGYIPDNVDRTEQVAFVYMAPFTAIASEKVPVTDLTVTEWSIRPMCTGAKQRPLASEDNVPGVGIKAHTRGGVAKNIFWGPGDDVDTELNYEVKVAVQANGMKGVGYGMVTLLPPTAKGGNRIFLRHPTGFYKDTIYADGEQTSTWEVLARPEEEISGPESGNEFRNFVLDKNGLVPSLEDGKVVTMSVHMVVNAEGDVPERVAKALTVDNVRIKTNLTGDSGKARSASAKVVNGKATFEISVNTIVPKAKDVEERAEDLEYNLYYVDRQFDKIKNGVGIILSVYTNVEVNGRAIAFYGGGGHVVNDAPPAFIELVEPLHNIGDNSTESS